MCRTRGHADTHWIRAGYVSDTPRGVSLTIYMVNDFGYGSNMIRTRLEWREEMADGGSGSRLQQKEEGRRREKGEGGRGEDESGALGRWERVGAEGRGVGGRGEHEEVGSQKRQLVLSSLIQIRHSYISRCVVVNIAFP